MMSKGIGALIVSASDPDLKDEATKVLHGIILDCIRLTTPPPPASGGFPHGFSDLDRGPSSRAAAPGSANGVANGTGIAVGTGGAAAAAAAAASMQDPKADVDFSPLEAVVEHLRGRRATSPGEITDAIVDGLSDVRKDVQSVASELIG